MHSAVEKSHGRLYYRTSPPCAKQPVPCVRSWSSAQRRVVSVTIAADVAAPLRRSAVADFDECLLVASAQQPAAEHALVQPVPHTSPVQPPSATAVGLVAAPPQPLQQPQQQEVVAQHDQLYLAAPAQQQEREQSMVGSPAEAAAKLQQQRQLRTQKRRGRRRNHSPEAAATAASGAGPPVNASAPPAAARRRKGRHQQQQTLLAPCERGGGLRLAAAASKLLRQGRQVLLPAGFGMQISRGLAALASARTLMLSTNSATGLVFQPSFSNNRAAVGRQAPEATAGQAADRGAAAASGKGPASKGSSSSSSSNHHSILVTASRVAEAQLRRHEQDPLIATRYGSPAKLAAAAVARVCQQGYTAVRASGPDAARNALQAVTEARHKLLSSGLDIAVVPATEFVDVDSLPGQQEQQAVEQGDSAGAMYGTDDSNSRQFVRVTVLHVLRCQLKQPWKLLPQPVPVSESPAVLWHKRQNKRHKQQQQPQQDVLRQQCQEIDSLQKPQHHQSHRQHGVQQQQEVDLLQAQQQDQVSIERDSEMHWEQQHEQRQQQQQQRQPQLLQQRYWVDTKHLQSQQAADGQGILSQATGFPAADSSSHGSNMLHLDGLAGGSAMPLVPAAESASAVSAAGPHRLLPSSHNADVNGVSASSMDGSIWCQADDGGFSAVYVGEGMSCCDDEVELLQLQTASAGHACHNLHPGQALLLQKQRQGHSSKRQLVAAAQRPGQRAVGGSNSTSN